MKLNDTRLPFRIKAGAGFSMRLDHKFTTLNIQPCRHFQRAHYHQTKPKYRNIETQIRNQIRVDQLALSPETHIDDNLKEMGENKV